MCGIIGYVGKRQAAPIMLEGLRRLEYRGYDSSGMAVVSNGEMDIRKCAGRIESLATLLDELPLKGKSGVSHTRWATHGAATDVNAHPHFDQSGRLAMVHNGVIENYQILRAKLEEKGHHFRSETDSEVLAHLIGHYYDESVLAHSRRRLLDSMREALNDVKGTYGIAVTHLDVPDLIAGARLGSPLIVGLGSGENFIASDVGAVISHTKDAIYLNDYDLVTIEAESFEVETVKGGVADFKVSQVEFTADDSSKGDYAHFMLKEIHEQPESLRNAMRGRLSVEDATAKLGGLDMTPRELADIERIVLSGCGTAMHAGLAGEYLIESMARIPTEVEVASEFRYRNTPLSRNTMVLVISQSGETIDTLAALREGQRKGHRVLGICNNVASTIARESDGGVYMHAGPEIGVAATKSFTSQVTVLTLLGLLLGRMRHLSFSQGSQVIDELQALPDLIEECIKLDSQIAAIAHKYVDVEGMLFLGRQYNYATAMEGALKMKEISYIYASGHPSAELKHGIIALVKEDMPCVFIAPDDAVFEKNVSNIEEVKARKGPVVAVTTEGKTELESVADDVLYIPHCPDYLTPIVAAVPLQLLAYHVAVLRGCDVDKPRNLAKSVTVE